MQKARDATAITKKQKAADVEAQKDSKRKEIIAKACKNLCTKGDAHKLAIGGLIALIRWQGGKVPADTSKRRARRGGRGFAGATGAPWM